MKRCIKCNRNKSLINYTKDSQTKDGLRSKCRSCMSKYKKIMRSTDEQREKSKIYALKKKYNLTMDEYSDLISNGCHSCGATDNIAVDHDHLCCPGKNTCGKCIRGALCRRCNTTEGMFKDNPKAIYGLIEYMKKHKLL